MSCLSFKEEEEEDATCSPSPRDGQGAAAGARGAVLRLVGGGGAGRPGLIGLMGEVLLQRVQFVPHNHLGRRGDALSPAEQERRKTSKRTSVNRKVSFFSE